MLKKSIFFKIMCLLLIALLCFYISNNWYQLLLIQGYSMETAYHSWQLTVIDKKSENYVRGDVVAFRCSKLDSILVKRIVGIPGDNVRIANGVLYINNEPSKEYGANISYAGIAEEPILLNDGEYFVIGDNFEYSRDSRYANIGCIVEEDIIGRVIPQIGL